MHNRSLSRNHWLNRGLIVLVTTALVVVSVGCSGYTTYRSAQVAEDLGNWDDAVLHYMELVRQDPSNLSYKSALLRAKISASHEHFEAAKEFRDAKLYRQAVVELQKAVQLDPTNQYAQAELVKVREQLEFERRGLDLATIKEMKDKLAGSTGQPPVLNPRSNDPIDLDFPEPVSVKKIYQALGRAFGINVLFDPKLRDQEITITLRDVTAQDALEILMRTSGHFYKVVDEQSIIVVADTPQNRRNYEDLIIQTFFLSNSDVKEVMAMLRSLVDARKIASNEALNAIILRDTADKVKVAERIIRANDKARAEVALDVELLLLNTNALQDLGMSLSSYQVGWQVNTGGEESALRFSDLEFLNENDWTVTIPSFVFDFLKQASDAQTLAKPQLRISEGERARLRIGERVPVPVTSFNTANTVGSNVVPITSFQYQDVGIIIEVEPRVHHNEEVSLQISVEISNIAGNIDNQPIIGTRNIETTIRLQDGETNFLAGLIRTDETNSENGIPGLSDVPVLGRLFSKERSQNQRTDIVLTLTPHIIRRADITEEDLTPIWVGTESNISVRGGSPRVESPDEGPFDDDQAEDAQDRMRRRLQQLPRGLRRQQEQEQQENAPPPGIDLVPSSNQDRGFRRDEEEEPEPEEPPRRGSLDRLEGLPEAARQAESSIGLASQTLGTSDEALADLAALAGGGRQPQRLSGGDDLAEQTVLAVQNEVEEAPVVLRLSPAAVKVEAQDTFDVKLRVASREEIAHVPVTLAYDPQVIEFTGAINGGFLGQQAQVLSDASEPGRLIVGASRLGDVGGVQGDGDVVSLQFRALADGETALRFEKVEVLDDRLSKVRTTFRDTLVIVGEGSAGGGASPRPSRPVGLRAGNESSGPKRLDASDLEGIDPSSSEYQAPAVESTDLAEVSIEKAAPPSDVIAELLEQERRLDRPSKDFVTPELLASVLDQMKQSSPEDDGSSVQEK